MKPLSFWAGWSVGSLAITKSRSSGPDTTISPRGAHSSQGLARGASKTTPLDEKKIVASIQKLILFKTPHGIQIETEPRPYLLLSRCTGAHRPLSASLPYAQTRSSRLQDDVSHRVAMSIFDLLETIKVECEDSKAVRRLQAANSTDSRAAVGPPIN